ncbi:hypothetical protein [Pseudorhodoferax sp. Leaf265]|uniref:hypothetical protein n=1 Tax=Pseudorhodoferax sp. Leaf265 TaxID=1736315 RepID=UPI0006F55A60|nr:hypothetical protein [Pseudorhodoferax sp. Leaf265]KQP02494.1 hypothetical protein ASF45_20790 [Pseudorhodoferax sp. Leaf265]
MDGWLKSGKYLPEPLRDFHDQKDVFKAIHATVNVEGHEYAKTVDWVAGQCYVIDIFLWWMAKRGYTLQKTRTRLQFRDLGQDVAAANELRTKRLIDLMRTTKEPQP